MVLCFVALFVQLNNIQVLKANSLANDPQNPRYPAARPQPDPGQHPLVGRDRAGLLGAGPAGQHLQVPAGLQPANTATLFAQIVGFDSSMYGNYRASRPSTTATSPPHPAGQDAPGPAHQPHRDGQRHPDHRTRTCRLQVAAGARLTERRRGSTGRRRWSINLNTGAIEAMYSNPSFNPNPLVSAEHQGPELRLEHLS